MNIKKQGFTLVEIMIVVLIIGLLAAVAIPNFVRAREQSQKTACIDNLRAIESAVEQAKMEGIQAPGEADLIGADKYIKKLPKCPTVNQPYATFDPPTCPGNIEGHVLPTEADD